jgi:signal transduction histidine kinase
MGALSLSRLRARLVLLVVLAVLPMLGLILFNDMEQRRFAASQAQEDALRLAQLAAAAQAHWIQSAHQLLLALAQLPAVRDGDASACAALFTRLRSQHQLYVNLGAARTNGELFCSTASFSQPLNVAHFAWFQRIVQGKNFTIGDYQKSMVSNEYILVVGYPVLDAAGQLQGVVAASLDVEQLNQLAAQVRLPHGVTLTAVDRNGVIVARYPDPQQWVGLLLPDNPLIQAMLARGEGTLEGQGIDGVQRLHAFTQVREAGDVGLHVSVGIPTEMAFAPIHRRLMRNLFMLGAMTMLMLVVAWIGSNLLVLRPVYALLHATERLRGGDLRARTGLPHGVGELDQLLIAFDDMAEALEHRETERRRAQEALQRLSRRLLEAQENERRAIARELHDEFGQALQALKINLQTAQRLPADSGQRLADSIDIVNRTLQQVRNLSLDLRPSLLDDLGVVAALEWYLERHAQRTGITAHFEADPPELRLEPTLETVCFRVVQEALTNVARYAQARNVWVELLQHGAHIDLVVRDDGVGFDAPAARARAAGGTSFGLLGMQERVELVGGRLDIISSLGQGTEIHARFPAPAPRDESAPSAAGAALSIATSAREPVT